MQKPLIALCGPAGSGKSTIAAVLQRRGYVLVKFATPLKNMLRAIGLTDAEIEGELKEQPCALLGGQTPRHAMQTLGTEWGRKLISRDIWVNAWRHEVEARLAAGEKVVVDDCRFPNELVTVLHLGGFPVRLERAGAGTTAHASETGLADIELPVLANDGEPAEAVFELIKMMEIADAQP